MENDTSGSGLFIESILEAVHQMPAADLIDLRIGPYWVLVNTSLGAGMASALRSEAHLHGSQPVAAAGTLHRWSPLELCELLRSASPPEGAIGLAAANALLGPTAIGLRDEMAVEILRERGRGRKVAMIGHFPFADGLREQCDQLWIFERGLNRRHEDLGEEEMEQILPQADVVAVTATTLLNRTLPTVLAGVRSDAFATSSAAPSSTTPRPSSAPSNKAPSHPKSPASAACAFGVQSSGGRSPRRGRQMDSPGRKPRILRSASTSKSA
jgi:uncharacterized protein (DUF4213/DUF364 family)